MSTLDGEQLEPSKGSSLESSGGKNGNGFDDPVVTKPGESDKIDATWMTSRRELWAFYLYYVVRSPRFS